MNESIRQHSIIDRKLVSLDTMEVVQGLNELNNFIDTLHVTEIFNSMLMRLMDLFSKSKISYVKIKVSHLISRFGDVIPSLPSHEQAINNLYKSLKSQDQIMRILTMEIIVKNSRLFFKDNSTYHLLLSRLRKDEEISIKQKLMVIKSIKTILQNSKHLSKYFSQNLNELHEIGAIQIKLLIYLCLFADFQTYTYHQIVRVLWQMVKNRGIQTGKTVYYFKQFTLRAISVNYKSYMFYQQELQTIFPSLSQKIENIINLNYDFLSENIDFMSLSNSVLLDLAYQFKRENNFEYLQKIATIMTGRIIESCKSGKIASDFNIILMTFYCTHNLDQLIFKCLQQATIKNQRILLKILLVTANFKSASYLLESQLNKFHWKYETLILIKLYLILHLNPNTQNLSLFFQMVEEVDNNQLSDLLKLWKAHYMSQHQQNNIDSEQQLSTHFNKNTKLPAKFNKQNQFKYVYLEKKVIMKIFNNLQIY